MPGESDRRTESSPHAEQHDPDGPLRKRRRGDDGTSATRKRATTACLLCRRRKAKCDNVRPQCGYCRTQKSACQYNEDVLESPKFDPASQTILERLDELKGIVLNNGGQHLTEPEIGPRPGTVVSNELSSIGLHSERNGELVPAQKSPAARGSLFSSKRKSNTLQTSPESILQWPVLRTVLPQGFLRINSFLFDKPLLPPSPACSRGSGCTASNKTTIWNDVSRQGLDEERMPGLCGKFIRLVHPRNPILDAESLLGTSRQVAEHGLTWDAHSCLLLIVCGIACLTTPWATPQYFADMADHVSSPNLLQDAKPVAEAYFHAARKRIGLLDDSITSIQCFFFASIYEKHALRPIEAFQYIQQGFTRLQVYRLRNESSRASGENVDIADRLLWSLVKAESELQPEIGITSVWPRAADISEALPAPPMHLSSSQSGTTDESEELEQRGWYFYLAEVSLRRRIEETLALMYEDSETLCADRPGSLVSRYKECATQLDLWYSHLHPSVQFQNSAFPNNELAFYLQGRFYEWRTLLLRPFLYYATSQDPKRVPKQIINLASEYVAICAENITHLSYHGRHGGTWFACRSTFGSAVSVLAAVTAGNQALCQLDWLACAKLSLRTLDRWGPEAEDVELMRQILDGLLAEVCKREGIL